MKNVYILTENGSEYSDEGCSFITEMIQEKKKDYSRLVFCMGQAYNNAEYFCKALQGNPDSYVIVSTSKRIILMDSSNFDALIENIRNNSDQTCWKTASESWEQSFAKYQKKINKQ